VNEISKSIGWSIQTWTSFFVSGIFSVSRVGPATEKYNVFRSAQQSISRLKRGLADWVGDVMKSRSNVSRLGGFPAHRNVSRAIFTVSIVVSSLVVRDVSIYPSLSTGDNCATSEAANEFVLRGSSLLLANRRYFKPSAGWVFDDKVNEFDADFYEIR
jgi:hypothetical protein